MAKIFRKQYAVKLPKRLNEEEEFGPGKKGLIICPDCKSVYYKKHWHHSIEKLNNSEVKGISKAPKKLPMRFALCPACKMIKNKQFEGQIILKNIPSNLANEVEGLINGFGDRAYKRDPMDRVISIKKKAKSWEVTTTENELANKLANKIKNSFNRVKIIKDNFGPEPSDVVYITIEFQFDNKSGGHGQS